MDDVTRLMPSLSVATRAAELQEGDSLESEEQSPSGFFTARNAFEDYSDSSDIDDIPISETPSYVLLCLHPPAGPVQLNVPLCRAFKRLEQSVDDTITVAKLAARLYTYLGLGWRWYMSFWRLIIFTLLLMPGFAQMVAFYYLSPRLLRSITYGDNPRNRLDIYLPRHHRKKKAASHTGKHKHPVVIYVTGGAWTIGYKAWGALFGRRLSQRGVLVFCLDYRNFPQGSAEDMLEDVNTGIAWVLRQAHIYSGAADNVFIVGQSAGGHLTAFSLLSQARRTVGALQPGIQPRVVGGYPSWDIATIKAWVGVSAAYDLVALSDYLHRRGLYKSMFAAIHSVEGKPALRELSPTHFLTDTVVEDVFISAMPPLLVLHGTADKSIPIAHARSFQKTAKAAGLTSRLVEFKGVTHTQPIVEGPMRGGRDEVMDVVLSLITGQKENHRQSAMCPAFLIDLASAVCPF